MMQAYVGGGKVEITPEIGTPLAGYMGEQRRSISVNDSLYARVITIKKDQDYFIIISLDLLAIDKLYAEQCADLIFRHYHIPSSHVFIHATHTHSGPGGVMDESSIANKAFPYLNGYITKNSQLVTEQQKQIIKAVGTSISSLEPCEIKYSEAKTHGIALNRNDPDRTYALKLKIVEFKYKTGKKNLLYSFPCHPTIMHSDNLSISADFPGVTSSNLEKCNDINLALFLNGPCGDISTRFTRKDSTFNEVNRLGTLLSDEILNLLSNTEKQSVSKIKINNIKVEALVREFDSPTRLRSRLKGLEEIYEHEQKQNNLSAEFRKYQSEMEGISSTIHVGDNIQNIKSVETKSQILLLGKIILVGVPGELFDETGREIESAIDNFNIIISGNTNDHIGYIVPRPYYKQAHYESFMTLFTKETTELFKNNIVKGIQYLVENI